MPQRNVSSQPVMEILKTHILCSLWLYSTSTHFSSYSLPMTGPEESPANCLCYHLNLMAYHMWANDCWIHYGPLRWSSLPRHKQWRRGRSLVQEVSLKNVSSVMCWVVSIAYRKWLRESDTGWRRILYGYEVLKSHRSFVGVHCRQSVIALYIHLRLWIFMVLRISSQVCQGIYENSSE